MWVQFPFFLLLLVPVSYCSIHLCDTQQDNVTPLVPALFFLGDSIMDVGNNNRFLTVSKANYYPYGMDFPGNLPTGRYSNGYNAADYFAVKFGLPLTPAFHNPATKGQRLLQGVNFASGGSGILPQTGKIYGQLDALQEQIKSLQDVKQELIMLLGPAAAQDLLEKAVYVIVSGSNDWLLSYFEPILPIQNITSQDLRDTIIETLLAQVEDIYTLGGRKIVVSGIPALGCCPSQVARKSLNGMCVEEINNVCLDYNEKLLAQLLALNDKLPFANVAYIDIYSGIVKAAQDPAQFGFKTGNMACCGFGQYKGFLTCLPGVQPCENVEDHLYWDAYHPTQKFYPYLVELLWNNGPPYAYPKSLQEMFRPS